MPPKSWSSATGARRAYTDLIPEVILAWIQVLTPPLASIGLLEELM